MEEIWSPMARPSWPPCRHRRGVCRGGHGRLDSTRPTSPPLGLYIGQQTLIDECPRCVFFRCCVLRLPEAALFLLSPTSAVPCARTLRTATSCSRSPRRALRLVAAAERGVAGPAPSGPGHQTKGFAFRRITGFTPQYH